MCRCRTEKAEEEDERIRAIGFELCWGGIDHLASMAEPAWWDGS